MGVDDAADMTYRLGLALRTSPSAGPSIPSRGMPETERPREVPLAPMRLLQRLRLKVMPLHAQAAIERRLLRAQDAALAAPAPAPPRFLVRVDEFPHARAWADDDRYGVSSYRRFHELMQGAGVPYLVAVLPRVSDEPLDPRGDRSRPLLAGERQMLAQLQAEEVSFALHGLTHRTRHASPRRHSELSGLTAAQTLALIDRGLAELRDLQIEPAVFVAPYNRFDARQLPLLAERFEVVCGGPESVGALGLQQMRRLGQTFYLPSYRPFYGAAKEILPAAEAAIERQTGLWTAITLHWEWERRDGWRSLSKLLEAIAPHAAPWGDFLLAIRSARERLAES